MNTDEETLKRRRDKFSKEATLQIRNDLLRDAALLSRSSSDANLETIINDYAAREKIVRELEQLFQSRDNDALLEHGLRKLAS